MKKNHVILQLTIILAILISNALVCMGLNPATESCPIQIELNGLRITSESLNLRYQIRNTSDKDIWCCASHYKDWSQTEVLLAKDGKTLVFSCMILPAPAVLANWGDCIYIRVRSGETSAGEVSVEIPVWPRYGMRGREFFHPGLVNATRLALEIGYIEKITERTLTRHVNRYGSISNYVGISYPLSKQYQSQKIARLIVEGVHIPFSESSMWIAMENPKLIRELNKSTEIEVLQALFSDFEIGLEDFQYAQQLFSVNEDLLGDSARSIAKIYSEVVEGKLAPEELSDALERSFENEERERILAELASKQDILNKNKRDEISRLLKDASHLDSKAGGRKALELLNRILSIDPSSHEAFHLKSKISNYFRGDSIQNSLDMELVWIPAGEFIAGEPTIGQFPVRISSGFWMSTHEITQAQYEAVMGENPSKFVGTTHPVEQVTWHDANGFCRKLSLIEKKVYRMPTEAEWECACRAGINARYAWGDKWRAGMCNADNQPAGDFHGNSKLFEQMGLPVGGTMPVGTFKANAFGLFDMHGNVAEWCQDSLGLRPFFQALAVDPKGVEDPFGVKHVVRGGAWGGHWLSCRCYDRAVQSSPERRSSRIGFRVVMIP